jgi:hypothetical protein
VTSVAYFWCGCGLFIIQKSSMHELNERIF